jgi:hypothetical protein
MDPPDGEVVVADPTAAGLAIKEPVAIRHAEPRSQGRDPSIVGSHLDSSKRVVPQFEFSGRSRIDRMGA